MSLVQQLSVVAVVVISMGVLVKATLPPRFPLYKQCDPRWGNQLMGVDGPGERASICREGCAMSAVAMAMAGKGIMINKDGTLVYPTPGTLNEYLISHHGYDCVNNDCNNLVLDAPNAASMGRFRFVGEWGGECCGGDAAKPSLATMQEELSSSSDRHMVYILHVHDAGHFVLATGWDAATSAFTVLDPYYNTSHYSYDDIGDMLIYSVLPSEAQVTVPYPLFKQTDYRWGNDIIKTKTVGAVGCLMSSITMAIAGHHIMLPQKNGSAVAPTPGTMNAWLLANEGYTSGNDLIEAVVPKIDPSHISWNETSGMHRTNDLSWDQLVSRLANARPVIANVDHGGHFVLVTGYNPSNRSVVYVNDPGFMRTSYAWSDIVGWRLFEMTNV